MRKDKKKLKIWGFSILILLITIVVSVHFSIMSMIDREIRKSVKLENSYKDIDVSVFSNFPNVTVDVSDVFIKGKDIGESINDTLFSADKISVICNPIKIALFKEFDVKKMEIFKPRIHLHKKDSKANWNISASNLKRVDGETLMYELNDSFKDNILHAGITFDKVSSLYLTPRKIEVHDGEISYSNSKINYTASNINHLAEISYKNDSVVVNCVFLKGNMNINTLAKTNLINDLNFNIYGKAAYANSTKDINFNGISIDMGDINWGVIGEVQLGKKGEFYSNVQLKTDNFSLAELTGQKNDSNNSNKGSSNAQIRVLGNYSNNIMKHRPAVNLQINDNNEQFSADAFKINFKNFNTSMLFKYVDNSYVLDGEVNFEDTKIKLKTYDTPIDFSSLRLTAINDTLNVTKLLGNVGDNKFEATGVLGMYSGLLVNDYSLTDINFSSDNIELNSKSDDSGKVNYFKLQSPKANFKGSKETKDLNVDFSARRLVTNDLNASSVGGNVIVDKSKVKVNDLKAYAFGGRVDANIVRERSTGNTELDLRANNVDISKLSKSLKVYNEIMPVATDCKGNVTLSLNANGRTDSNFDFDPESLSANGNIKSSGLKVKAGKAINKTYSLLGKPTIDYISTSSIDVDFIVKNQRVDVSPFKTSIMGTDFRMSGWHTFDQKISYNITAELKRSELKKALGTVGLAVSSKGGNIPVDIMLRGSSSNPDVSIDTDKALAQVQKELGNIDGDAINELLQDEDVKKTVDNVLDKLNDLFK